ncbi:hypothetical protein RIF25_11925 [Thermosynechococcaceae cyanobacterium BACA0444]|uniref:Uncharacterized protein n=1 Tax=Pseudocalidococcus azoricus BACA0444 TaxID=2918990 RepID=A0AAE4FSJ9_9CYAN|nr:hypothetical protein [Pseudocalidococcus azoricus]MDS3861514.1 hypothetical protein [Pseudocalidococcus azoricus BACA0444]
MINNLSGPIGRHVLYPLLASGLGLVIALILGLGKFDGNVTGFFRIGDVIPVSPYLSAQSVFIHQGKTGHDGQQFLTIALDPGLGNPQTLKSLDVPAYRYRRIFYPFLGWLLGLGQSGWIPYTLVLVNILCFGVSVWGLGKLLPQQPSSLPLLFLTIPGLWISFSIATADLLSTTLVILTLGSYQQKRPWQTWCWQALALLTRETTLLVWFALVMTSGLKRRKLDLVFAPLALVPWGLWNFYLRWRLGPAWDSQSLGTHFSWPLTGIIAKVQQLITTPMSLTQGLDLIVFLVQIAVVIGIGLAVRQAWGKQPEIVLAGGLYSLMFILAKLQILNLFTDYSRVFLDLYLFLLLLWPYHPVRYRIVIFSLLGLVSVAYLLGFATEPV